VRVGPQAGGARRRRKKERGGDTRRRAASSNVVNHSNDHAAITSQGGGGRKKVGVAQNGGNDAQHVAAVAGRRHRESRIRRRSLGEGRRGEEKGKGKNVSAAGCHRTLSCVSSGSSCRGRRRSRSKRERGRRRRRPLYNSEVVSSPFTHGCREAHKEEGGERGKRGKSVSPARFGSPALRSHRASLPTGAGTKRGKKRKKEGGKREHRPIRSVPHA